MLSSAYKRERCGVSWRSGKSREPRIKSVIWREREGDITWPLESRGRLNGGCNDVFNI